MAGFEQNEDVTVKHKTLPLSGFSSLSDLSPRKGPKNKIDFQKKNLSAPVNLVTQRDLCVLFIMWTFPDQYFFLKKRIRLTYNNYNAPEQSQL